MVNYKIEGTPLPTIKGVGLRLSNWNHSRETHYSALTFENFVSYGATVISGEIWILSETKDFSGSNYYMFKLDDINRLAGQTSNIMQDFTIAGTEIPKVNNISVRLSHWADSTNAIPNCGEYSGLVSYGSRWVNGELWVLCDYKSCSDTNHYMVRLKDLNKAANQPNIPQIEPSKVSIPEIKGDGPLRLIKPKILKINLVD